MLARLEAVGEGKALTANFQKLEFTAKTVTNIL